MKQQNEIETTVDNQAEFNQWLVKKLIQEKDRTIENLEEQVEQLQGEESSDVVHPCIFTDCEVAVNNEVELARHLADHEPEKVASAVENTADTERIVDYINSVASEDFLIELDKNLDDFDLGYEWKEKGEADDSDIVEEEEFECSHCGKTFDTKKKRDGHEAGKHIKEGEIESEVDLTERASKILEHIPVDDYVTSVEIAEATDLTSQQVRNSYKQLKKKEVIETHKNYGVKRSDKGEKAVPVKEKEAETEVEEKTQDELETKIEDYDSDIIENLPPKSRSVLMRVPEDDYLFSTQIAERIEGVTPQQVRNAYAPLNEVDLLDSHTNKGVRLSEKAKQILEGDFEEERKIDEETIEPLEKVKERAERVTDKQWGVMKHLNRVDWTSTADITEWEDENRERIRGRAKTLRNNDLIEGRRGAGIGLTALGVRVKEYLENKNAGKKASKLSENEIEALEVWEKDTAKELDEVTDISGEALDSLEYEDLIETNRFGYKLTEEGASVLRILGRYEGFSEQERVLAESERQQMKKLFKANPEIKELDNSVVQKLQQYFLTKDRKARTVEKTGGEVYGIQVEEGTEEYNKIEDAYDKNEGVMRVQMGEKTTYQPKKALLEELDEKEVDTEDEEEQEWEEDQEYGIRDLKKQERKQIQRDYLDQSKVSASLNDMGVDIYGQELDSTSTARTLIYEATEQIDGIQTHRDGKEKRYYLREEQKDNFEMSKEGSEAVKRAIEDYGEVDGQPIYNWLKKAMKELIPEQGETVRINYYDVADEITGRDEKEQRKIFNTLIASTAVQKALKYQIDPEMDIKRKGDLENNTKGLKDMELEVQR